VRGATCRARRGLSKCAAMRSQRFCEGSEVERNETQKAKKVRLAEHVARSDFSGCSLEFVAIESVVRCPLNLEGYI
jgi:hypothetical protein